MQQENLIASDVLNICFDIHKLYGPGLFERVYEEILCYELGKREISFKRQYPIPVIHDNIKLDVGFVADVIIEDLVLIELKSVARLEDVHFKQVLTYLRLTGIRLGLLINFNEALLKNGIKRIAN
ncbi:MAG TPA: GxxExxY protein [Ferruginibacter sp.]|nr:GxxExxY protein [Ferruginibacter sp.]HMP21314.1 GxxExxY protein [Ferruginibacter sp.]